METSDAPVAAVVDNVAEQRFEARAADGTVLGVSVYTVDDGAVVFLHTEVEPENEGQGIASVLVRGALDQVRASGRQIVALCPYVRAWLRKHRDYADLVRAPRPPT